MKRMFNYRWKRIPRKVKKKIPFFYRWLRADKLANVLMDYGYEYIMIKDFFKEYKGSLDFKTVYAVYSKWDQENDRYYYPEEYPNDDLEEDDYQKIVQSLK